MPAPPATAVFAQGWAMGAALILAIGAQNALVLRQGLRREHVGAVIAVCTLSDWLLIALGVFGLGALIQASPALLEAFRFGGAAFLLGYALLAARRAWRPGAGLQAAGSASSLGATLSAAFAFTYLNPHVYLDTVVLLGGLGARQPAGLRAAFAAGAGLASAMWFGLLGFGAAAAAPRLQGPRAWRLIDALVALLMGALGLQLLLQPL
ncbi:LysE/ArgO family amino acid transporter [Pelomonas aquatica]|jgi:L-lysine exporter family protein LysE/ArgO|uniref:Amino acid transporter n=1 Tax=Pelomonas aquatica TaxID=431058 RepID=A0A9X4LET0_9BURK|nr:LysE family transporter [Pelomonas aquatica]MCY4752913.1 LysE family transporter [Pelomonas aquatica]MDG0862145.1 amino acid transporter [Pelomonas aquatica]